MAVSARTPSVSAAGLSVALRLQMQLPGQGKIRTSALNGHIPPEPTNIKALYFFFNYYIRGVAVFIKECLEVYYGTDPDGGQASDQP